MTIYMLVGLPASGKSTWAREFIETHPNAKRISKDDLRAMLQNGKYSPEMEESVLTARNSLLINLVRAGHDIIVDDKNLNPKHQEKIKDMANQLDVELFIKEFDIPVDLCVLRDSKRDNPVGEQVIRDMYEKYLA